MTNDSQLDQMIEVLQAARAGKEIQCRKSFDVDDVWGLAGPTWDFSRWDYRVKPEPREWILHVPDHVFSFAGVGQAHIYPSTSGSHSFECSDGVHCVRVREVVE